MLKSNWKLLLFPFWLFLAFASDKVDNTAGDIYQDWSDGKSGLKKSSKYFMSMCLIPSRTEVSNACAD